MNEKKKKNTIGSIVKKVLLLILETVLLLVITLYGVMFVLVKGPSVTARNMFVKSVRETSAIGFLANLYLTPEQIAGIELSGRELELSPQDNSLVEINASTAAQGEPDEWGLVDEDGDGIIVEEVKGSSYSGYMMVVKDPSRIAVGFNKKIGYKGYTVEQYVHAYDAVAGVNGGGFMDDNGAGDGSEPDTLLVYCGQIECGWQGSRYGFVGIDKDYRLRVDCQTTQEIEEAGIQFGCCYGPILVKDGKILISEGDSGGVNPRTAIGQRSDGAILLLVIDGRHVASLGASYLDLAEIMVRYGAVNAGNMDGGSSSLMYYQDEYVNNKAAVIGVRPIPTAWLVLKEGVTLTADFKPELK